MFPVHCLSGVVWCRSDTVITAQLNTVLLWSLSSAVPASSLLAAHVRSSLFLLPPRLMWRTCPHSVETSPNLPFVPPEVKENWKHFSHWLHFWNQWVRCQYSFCKGAETSTPTVCSQLLVLRWPCFIQEVRSGYVLLPLPGTLARQHGLTLSLCVVPL